MTLIKTTQTSATAKNDKWFWIRVQFFTDFWLWIWVRMKVDSGSVATFAVYSSWQFFQIYHINASFIEQLGIET